MFIEFNGREYYFRPIDTGKISKSVLQSLAENTGHVEFDPFNSNYYLKIPNVAIGIENK